MAVPFPARNGALLGLAALLCALPALYAAPMYTGNPDELGAMFNAARGGLQDLEHDQRGSSRQGTHMPQASPDAFWNQPGFWDNPEHVPSSWAAHPLAGHGEASSSWIQPSSSMTYYGQGDQHSSNDRFSVGTSNAGTFQHATADRAGHLQAGSGPSQPLRYFSPLNEPADFMQIGQLEQWNAMHHGPSNVINYPFEGDATVEGDSRALPYHHPELDQPGKRGRRKHGSSSAPARPKPSEKLRLDSKAQEEKTQNQVRTADAMALQKIQPYLPQIESYAELDARLDELSEKELEQLGKTFFSDLSLLSQQAQLLQNRDGFSSSVVRKPIRIATAVHRALFQAVVRKEVVKAGDWTLPPAQEIFMAPTGKIAVSPYFYARRNDLNNKPFDQTPQDDKEVPYIHERLPAEAFKISLGPYRFHVFSNSKQSVFEGVTYPVTASPIEDTELKGFDRIDMGLLVLPHARDRAHSRNAKKHDKGLA